MKEGSANAAVWCTSAGIVTNSPMRTPPLCVKYRISTTSGNLNPTADSNADNSEHMKARALGSDAMSAMIRRGVGSAAFMVCVSNLPDSDKPSTCAWSKPKELQTKGSQHKPRNTQTSHNCLMYGVDQGSSTWVGNLQDAYLVQCIRCSVLLEPL